MTTQPLPCETNPSWWDEDNKQMHEQAAHICLTCPNRLPCLHEARTHLNIGGVCGGYLFRANLAPERASRQTRTGINLVVSSAVKAKRQYERSRPKRIK